MEKYEQFIQCIENINLYVHGENEHSISRNIIQRFAKNEELSLEKVCDDSHISQASISRFIRKMGFSNWSSFRENCTKVASQSLIVRKMIHSFRYQNKSSKEIADILYEQSINNLKATKEHLDIESLVKLVKRLQNADQVLFLGDDHALSIFFTLQLDLVFHGVPAYLYKDHDVLNLEKKYLTKDSVVISFNVEEKYAPAPFQETIDLLKKKHCFHALFAQQKIKGYDKVDFFYQYGIENSVNDGYYSLNYICKLLSELLNQE